MLSFEQIKELMELVSERGLQGLELERSGFKIRIDGKASRTTATAPPAAAGADQAETDAAPAAPQPQAPPPAPADEEAEGALPDGSHVVTSPIVGTFYASPNPEADPYVRVGDRVRKGQVLCIVEAMKLMNEIESDVDGKVLEVMPKNSQPVEFGEPLFAIEPD